MEFEFDGVVVTKAVQDRFWAKVMVRGDDDCWPWRGTPNRAGYGRLKSVGGRQGRDIMAHRLAYRLTAIIPDGHEVCHKCDTRYPVGDISYRRCCNPKHLWCGSHSENMADMATKRRGPEGERSGRRTHPHNTARGELHGRAVLTVADVLAIRREHAAGFSYAAIGQRLDLQVSRMTIRDAAQRRRWRHI